MSDFKCFTRGVKASHLNAQDRATHFKGVSNGLQCCRVDPGPPPVHMSCHVPDTKPQTAQKVPVPHVLAH